MGPRLRLQLMLLGPTLLGLMLLGLMPLELMLPELMLPLPIILQYIPIPPLLTLSTTILNTSRLMLITIGSTLSKTLITMISDIRRVDMGTRPLANITCLYQTGAFKQWHTWRMKMVTNPLLHTKDSLHILTQTRCLGHCVHSIVWHSRNDATAIIYWSQMMLECMIKVRMCSCPF